MRLIPESPRNRRAGIWFHSMAAWPGLQLLADRRNSSVWLNPDSEKYSDGLVPVREAEATKQASVLPIRHSAVRVQRPLPPGYARPAWRGTWRRRRRGGYLRLPGTRCWTRRPG